MFVKLIYIEYFFTYLGFDIVLRILCIGIILIVLVLQDRYYNCYCFVNKEIEILRDDVMVQSYLSSIVDLERKYGQQYLRIVFLIKRLLGRLIFFVIIELKVIF